MIRRPLAFWIFLLFCLPAANGQSGKVAYVDSLVKACKSLRGTQYMLDRFELIQEAHTYIKEIDDPSVIVEVHREMSLVLSQFGAIQEAIYHDRQCMFLADLNHQAPSAEKFRCIGRYASQFMMLGVMDSAEIYFRQSEEYAKSLNVLWQSSALNNLGIFYQRLGDAQKAHQYFDAALEIAPENNRTDSLLIVSIQDNQATLHLQEGSPEDGIRIFKKNIETLSGIDHTEPGQRVKYINAQIKLLDVYLEQEQVTNASQLLNRITAFIERFDIDPSIPVKVLERRLHLANLQGNTLLISQLANELLNVRDSIKQAKANEESKLTHDLISMGLARIEDEYQAQIDLREQKALYSKKVAQNRLLLTIVVALVASILLALLYLTGRKIIRQSNTAREEAEKQLENKSKDVDGLALELQKKKELTDQILETANELSVAEGEEALKLMQELSGQLRAQSRVEAQRSWVHQEVDTINNAFFDRLQKKHSNLAKTEIELSGLIRMGLGNREIADMRNITTASARIARYRLKKKLNLDKETDIEQYLKEV